MYRVLFIFWFLGYEEVKAELEGRKNELEVIQYMKVSAHIGMQYM